jgi:hypothetical protein
MFKRILSYAVRRLNLPVLRSHTFKLNDGSRFRLHNQIESHSLWIQSPEFDEGTEFMRAYLKPGDPFVDIGASVGRYSIPAALIAGPTGASSRLNRQRRPMRYSVKMPLSTGLITSSRCRLLPRKLMGLSSFGNTPAHRHLTVFLGGKVAERRLPAEWRAFQARASSKSRTEKSIC